MTTIDDKRRHVARAKQTRSHTCQACIRDSLKRGEAPFASHQMYTEALDDTVPEERLLGMTAGLSWHESAVAVVVYVDRGVSAGMQKGIEYAQALGLRIERREIGFERRVRAGMEEEPSISFDVTYMDQNEEPSSVWAEHENWIETEAEARGTAKEVSTTHEYKRAKVYRVTRELIGSYENGEEQTI